MTSQILKNININYIVFGSSRHSVPSDCHIGIIRAAHDVGGSFCDVYKRNKNNNNNKSRPCALPCGRTAQRKV